MTSYEPYPAPRPAPPQAKPLLVRSRTDKMVGGVCGGIAEFSGVDANLIRIVVVAATILGVGSTLIIYLAAWLLMPQAD